jgi:hypothetical protein
MSPAMAGAGQLAEDTSLLTVYGAGGQKEPTPSRLELHHAEHLADSAIDPDIIEARGYRSVSAYGAEQLEPRLSKAQRRAGLLIPVYRLAWSLQGGRQRCTVAAQHIWHSSNLLPFWVNIGMWYAPRQ